MLKHITGRWNPVTDPTQIQFCLITEYTTLHERIQPAELSLPAFRMILPEHRARSGTPAMAGVGATRWSPPGSERGREESIVGLAASVGPKPELLHCWSAQTPWAFGGMPGVLIQADRLMVTRSNRHSHHVLAGNCVQDQILTQLMQQPHSCRLRQSQNFSDSVVSFIAVNDHLHSHLQYPKGYALRRYLTFAF